MDLDQLQIYTVFKRGCRILKSCFTVHLLGRILYLNFLFIFMANKVIANIAIKQMCDCYLSYSFLTFILIPVSVMYCVSEPIFLFRPVTYFYNQWLYRVWMVSQVSPLFYTLVGFILYVSLGE